MKGDWLTTSECAAIIGVTSGYIRGEIADGRLEASLTKRPHGRTIIRVSVEAFRAYLRQCNPDAASRLDRTCAA